VDIRDRLERQIDLADHVHRLDPSQHEATKQNLNTQMPGDARKYRDLMRDEATRLTSLKSEIPKLKIAERKTSPIAKQTQATWNDFVSQLSILVNQNQTELTELVA